MALVNRVLALGGFAEQRPAVDVRSHRNSNRSSASDHTYQWPVRSPRGLHRRMPRPTTGGVSGSSTGQW
jgi:hypothetical protein